MMWAAELFLDEIDFKFEIEIFAVPVVSAQDLLVVGAFLVPVREQRGGDIDALSIPVWEIMLTCLPVTFS